MKGSPHTGVGPNYLNADYVTHRTCRVDPAALASGSHVDGCRHGESILHDKALALHCSTVCKSRIKSGIT